MIVRDELVTRTYLTCPVCGGREELAIPVDACLFFHVCTHCGTRLRPKPGDCCVFCSYGDAQCIPKQREHLDTPKHGAKTLH